MAESHEMANQGARTSPRANISIRLASHANLETITKIVESIGGRYGCTTCGLAGIDVRLSGDPVEFEQFSQIAGVKSVNVG
ncbi:MAG: hypothetical protein M3Y50_11570 [Acidobacteriota bacterium]|nr:hypothetical protein [Acidobacteriota bacterium]